MTAFQPTTPNFCFLPCGHFNLALAVFRKPPPIPCPGIDPIMPVQVRENKQNIRIGESVEH